MNLEIYTTPTCGYCHQAKNYFRNKNIPFTDYNVAEDHEAAQRMVQLTGQRGVPVITIDSEHVIGFDLPRLEKLLSERTNGEKRRFGVGVADAARYSGQEGAYVGTVTDGLAGARAGLKAGDIIVGINEKRVFKANDLDEILRSLRPGEEVTVVLVRDGKPMQAKAVMQN